MTRFAQRSLFPEDDDPSLFDISTCKSRTTLTRPEVRKSALLSGDGRHRYVLGRHWDEGEGAVNFVMYNPSTADHREDDPTIRRCVGYAMAWGYCDLYVTNLFAFRSRNPRDLWGLYTFEATGHANDTHVLHVARAAKLVICAWGSNRTMGRDVAVLEMLGREGIVPHCLRQNAKGRPMHPLYARADLTPRPMRV
jgi:hypothetical protein